MPGQYQPPQQYGAPQYPPTSQYPAQQYPPAAPRKGNGLGVAAIILAILIPLVGLIFGIVAIFKSRTKALGIIAIVISLAMSALYTVLLIAAFSAASDAVNTAESNIAKPPAVTTTAPVDNGSGVDPVCVPSMAIVVKSGDDIQADQSNPLKVADDLNSTVTQLNEQKAKATDPAVIAALGALIKDYTDLGKALRTGNLDPNLATAMTQDATALTTACSG